MYPATPFALPAIVCTRPEVRLTARRRCPSHSDTYNTRPLTSSATPRGTLKVASVPSPSLSPAVPLPARVVTFAVAISKRRTRMLYESPMYSIPFACKVAEVGKLNCALVPLPSAKPQVPLPASVVTADEERSMARILHPDCSTMKAALPSEASAIPVGLVNIAAVPTPLLPPATPLPAIVETKPDGKIRRIRLLSQSVT
jgi:hypothetical protein